MQKSPSSSRLATLCLSLLSACSTGGAASSGGTGANRAPMAAAGDDREVYESDLVTLDGTRSADPDGDPLLFHWELTEQPAGSAAAFDDPSAATPRFLVDLAGRYVATLFVDDRVATSEPDRITLVAGPDRALRVGPSRALRAPSDAAAIVRDGEVVRIDAGEYHGDVATWSRDDLRLVASGGAVTLFADGRSAQGKAIWVIAGARTLVEGIRFEGCQVNDGNGAGIRLEGGHLTVRDCRFLRNQMGFLCGDLGATDLVFEGCEFGFSASSGALAHGIYVNRARSLELRHCFVHDASRGHGVKSRAAQTRILWCRIGDLSAGSSSYAVDLPDGGLAFLVGNVIHKGVDSQNEVAISFGEENRGVHPLDELHVAHNTVVIDRRSGAFVRVTHGTATLTNNVFCGAGPVLSGAGSMIDNLVSPSPGFVDRAAFDYRLVPGSPAIDAGLPAGIVRGVALTPSFEYRDLAACLPRSDAGLPDLGAFAFAPRP